MERLTDYSDDECTYIIGVGNKTCEEFCKNAVDGCKNCYIQQVFKKLADYEDLEDQGLLVRLPCKVGTEVFCYFPGDSHCTKCQIKKIEIRPTIFGKICYFAEPVAQRGCCFRYFDTEFGKVIFLTREEAEKKLEDIQNDKT
jgi:hypothetical protein